MGRRNAMQLLYTQGVEVTQHNVLIETVDLVDDNVEGLVALAQVAGQRLVRRVEALPGINQEQHRVGFLNGEQGLPGHLRLDAHFVAADTPGVDDHEGPRTNACLTVFAIPCEPGKVGDQRIAAAGELVEQSRLAHIGTADQGDYGNHRGYLEVELSS